LSRDPMMVLQPASITPEPLKKCCFQKVGVAHAMSNCFAIVPMELR